MTRTYLRIIVIGILFIPLYGHAENLVDLFNLALQNDPQLLEAKAKREALKEVRSQSIANFFPRVDAYGSIGRYTQTIQSFYNTSVGADFFGVPYQYVKTQYAISLRQPLVNIKDIVRFRGAGLQSVKADLEYRIAQQDFLLRLAERYFDVLVKEQELNFARAEKNAVAKQLTITKQRFDVGIIAVTDVHEAQARHDLSLAQEILAETQYSEAQERLRQISGSIPKSLFRLRAQMPLVPPTPTNINEWVDAAKTQNLAIAMAQLDTEFAQNVIAENKATRYPTVDIVGRYGYFDQAGEGLNQQKYTDWQMSLDINYSLFEGNRSSSLIRQAESAAIASQHHAEQVEQESTSQARAAYLGVLAGMSYVKALGQALTSSEKALKATEAGFDVNTRSAIDVLDAQRELYRNQRDFSRARVDYVLNTLRLKLAVGLLTIDDIEQINSWLE